MILKKRTFIAVSVLFLALTSCSRYIVKVPKDDKWKCIAANQVDQTSELTLIQKGKLSKGQRCDLRLLKIVPFQNLDQLPEARGLDDLIKDKNCTELETFFKSDSGLPITFLDSGPLDLSPKNARRSVRIIKGYQLLVRSNSNNIKISVKPFKIQNNGNIK